MKSYCLCKITARDQSFKIFKRMSKKITSHDDLLEDISSRKKEEEIYESAQESVPNQLGNSTKDKKETKLQVFLSRIDSQFQQEMQEYLVSNKESFNSNPSKNICLYEDIMIIWSFKKAEDDLKKKKKDTIDKLAAELEGITNKKAGTIKERIKKKLSNLSIEEIKVYMSSKTDFSFNDKKQLNNRPKCLTISSKNSNSNEQNEPLPVVTAIKREAKPVQPEPEINRYVQKKATKKVEQNPSKSNSMFNRSTYKYGTKNTTQRIKFFYNPSTKTLLSFKESDFQKMALSKQCQPSQPKPQPEIKNETVQNMTKPEQTRQEVIEIMKAEFKKAKQAEGIPLNIDNFSKIKAQTIKTIQILKKSQKTEDNIAYLKKLEQMLSDIDQKMKIIQKDQNIVSSKQSQSEEEDHSSLSKSHQKEGKLTSTGKKTLSEDSEETQKSKVPCLTMSQSEKKAQEQLTMRMICNNVNYLQALSKNGVDVRQYLWTAEEDNLLWSFKFSPNNYRQEMNCLLRYKSKAYLLQRMRFINIQIDQKLLQDLQNLSCSQPEIVKCFQGPKDVEEESIENLEVGKPMQNDMKEKE